jgi:hypothetical protein
MFVVDVRVRPILAAVLLLSLGGCGGKPPVDQWKTVSHSVFTIKMPGDPTREVQTMPVPGGKVDVTLFVVERGDEAYLAVASEFPAGTLTGLGIEESLESSRDQHIKNTPGGKLLGSKRIDVQGFPAIEFTFEATIPDTRNKKHQVMSYVRTVRVDERAIVMQFTGVPDKVDESQALEYWNTLKISAVARPTGTATPTGTAQGAP